MILACVVILGIQFILLVFLIPESTSGLRVIFSRSLLILRLLILVLILILLVKPTGLLGKQVQEKV